MLWEVNIDDVQIQLTLLALAQLSLERPGFQYAIGEVVAKFPEGAQEVYENFRLINGDTLPVSNVAETCAKIVETFLPSPDDPARDSPTELLKSAASEIRRYAADLAKLVNMGANHG